MWATSAYATSDAESKIYATSFTPLTPKACEWNIKRSLVYASDAEGLGMEYIMLLNNYAFLMRAVHRRGSAARRALPTAGK